MIVLVLEWLWWFIPPDLSDSFMITFAYSAKILNVYYDPREEKEVFIMVYSITN